MDSHVSTSSSPHIGEDIFKRESLDDVSDQSEESEHDEGNLSEGECVL